MRIDPVQVVAKVTEAEAGHLKQRLATQARLVESSVSAAVNRAPSIPKTAKYDVTVRYAENQILVTTFIDQNSGEVVQQIPPEQVLRIIETIQELLKESSQTRVLDTFR
jgi:uncharacterized FlaG/YvyC family protein